jgi:hypothetical protein
MRIFGNAAPGLRIAVPVEPAGIAFYTAKRLQEKGSVWLK